MDPRKQMRKTMPVIDVQNLKGKQISQVELADDVFSVPVKSSVLHEVVTMQLANRRSGTAAVKHRSDVRGSGRKLFRQKGTGRARRGDIKSPLLRGGGVVFGPDRRNYSHKVTKKVRKKALKMALKLENALIVTEAKNEHLELSSRNVQQVKVLRSEGLNVYDILKYRTLVLMEPAVKNIEGRLRT
jgi:large subunit ribosomal protein L4